LSFPLWLEEEELNMVGEGREAGWLGRGMMYDELGVPMRNGDGSCGVIDLMALPMIE